MQTEERNGPPWINGVGSSIRDVLPQVAARKRRPRAPFPTTPIHRSAP